MNRLIQTLVVFFYISWINTVYTLAQSTYMHEAQEDDYSLDGINYLMKLLMYAFIGVVCFAILIVIGRYIFDFLKNFFSSKTVSYDKNIAFNNTISTQDRKLHVQQNIDDTNELVTKSELNHPAQNVISIEEDWGIHDLQEMVKKNFAVDFQENPAGGYLQNPNKLVINYIYSGITYPEAYPENRITSRSFDLNSSIKCTEVYTDNNAQLIKVKTEVKRTYYSEENVYRVKEGTISICDDAIESDDIYSIVFPSTVFFIGDNAIKCPFISNLELPDSIVYIGEKALRNCHIKELTIPRSVIFIRKCALPTTLTKIINRSSWFKYVGNSLYNKEMTRLLRHLNEDSDFEIPESVTDITDAFCDNTFLESVKLPMKLSSIGESAFENCNNLLEINLTSRIKEIGPRAFKECCGLKSIAIPQGVTKIDDGVFEGCNHLESVIIPDGVNLIGDRSFARCISLTKISIPDGVSSIGIHAFAGCFALKSVIIPNGVLSIGTGAFRSCFKLKEVTISGSVSSIGGAAFAECGELTSIVIPSSVEFIGSFVFEGCRKLRSLEFQNPNLIIKYNIFSIFNSAIPNLSEIIVPKGCANRFKEQLPSQKEIIREKI